jgi:hypothetical protein
MRFYALGLGLTSGVPRDNPIVLKRRSVSAHPRRQDAIYGVWEIAAMTQIKLPTLELEVLRIIFAFGAYEKLGSQRSSSSTNTRSIGG